MSPPPRRVLLHESLASKMDRLPRAVQTSLQRQAETLALEPHRGQQLRKSKIPRTLRKRYKIQNLWRLALAESHRALSTLATEPTEGQVVLILWLGTHKEYDRLLGHATS